MVINGLVPGNSTENAPPAWLCGAFESEVLLLLRNLMCLVLLGQRDNFPKLTERIPFLSRRYETIYPGIRERNRVVSRFCWQIASTICGMGSVRYGVFGLLCNSSCSFSPGRIPMNLIRDGPYWAPTRAAGSSARPGPRFRTTSPMRSINRSSPLVRQAA